MPLNKETKPNKTQGTAYIGYKHNEKAPNEA